MYTRVSLYLLLTCDYCTQYGLLLVYISGYTSQSSTSSLSGMMPLVVPVAVSVAVGVVLVIVVVVVISRYRATSRKHPDGSSTLNEFT